MSGIFVINSLEGGGAERVFSTLIALLAGSGDQSSIEVILLDNKEEKYKLPSHIKVYRLNKNKSNLLLMVRFILLIYQLKPEYIVSFLTRANILNVIASTLCRCTSIISERSNPTGHNSGKFASLKHLIIRFFFKRSAAIIAVSNGVRQCLIDDFNIPPEKVFTLNNPVDIEWVNQDKNYPKISIEKNSITTMGRLIESKGFDTLIKAFAKTRHCNKLYIIGQGPIKEELSLLAASLNVSDRVIFLGFQSDPHHIVKQSSLFVFPSRLEGFPNALLEALALSVPVIATDCIDGPSEILNVNHVISTGEYHITEYGILINVDDEQAMTKAIDMVLTDSSLANTLSKNGLIRAKFYSKDTFKNNFLNILEQVSV